MLDENIIGLSNYPWIIPEKSPKKLGDTGNQKWRIVGDYRKLNELAVEDKYPLRPTRPVRKYFTKLDLASEFHQIEIDRKVII